METDKSEERFQVFGAWVLTVSSVPAWQLLWEITHCPHSGLVVFIRQEDASPGRQSAGRFGWLKSSVQSDGRVGGLTSNLAPSLGLSGSQSLRLSHVLSYGVTMLGGLVGGGDLWWMGTGGAGYGWRALPQAPTPPQVRESRRGRCPPNQGGIYRWTGGDQHHL